MHKVIRLFSVCLCLFLLTLTLQAQVTLQGFWWHAKNDNYPNRWADYLIELAPRLRNLGIDSIWIHPNGKQIALEQKFGYAPFDPYDLGDKFQKGSLRTRFGNKDHLLRLIANLHANGMDVIQDVVLNHRIYWWNGLSGMPGVLTPDPAATDPYAHWIYDAEFNKTLNFRNVCYLTPHTTPYSARQGRFPMNRQNFFAVDPWFQDEITAPYFGPDINYNGWAYGQSSNAAFNPPQSYDYVIDETLNWMVWYKKQLGFDGYRFDAVKHFDTWVLSYVLDTMRSSAGWASGGDELYAVGEYVGGKWELDHWVNNVGSHKVGTFDFSLRGALYGMVAGQGAYDLSHIPSAQQDQRARTVPFVNNHDTFRPTYHTNGNYSGWKSNEELSPHIDPFDPRLSIAYAVTFAVDGTPCVFFEDLFDIGGTGKRWSHDPKSNGELPIRDDIANLIWCHQNLDFKAGAYTVPHQSADHLVIERVGRAIISVNDTWNHWQSSWIDTQFSPGTILKDYSGAHGSDTRTVNAWGWVEVSTPPVNPGSNIAGRKGYAVWAPMGNAQPYVASSRSTTQEWQLDDDLGDSSNLSLQQGGKIPSNGTERTVGTIFVEAGSKIDFALYPASQGYPLEISLYDGKTNTLLKSQSGNGNILGSYTSPHTRWITMRAKNAQVGNPAQRVYVKATYRAPAVIDTSYHTHPTDP